MGTYNSIIGRAEVSEALLPDQVSQDILQEAPKQSIMLSRARRVAMSAAKTKQAVLSTLPSAYWVNGDTGLKQTSSVEWGNLTMTAEELAVIVPIPDALISDSQVPLWDEIRPLVAEAFGQKIDAATIFGEDKPDSWPDAIIKAAKAAGNSLAIGSGATSNNQNDFGVDVADLAGRVAKQGYHINGFISEPGLNWELVGMRDGHGQPIYHPAIAEGQPGTLYGMPLDELYSGGFDSTKAKLIAVDWSKFIIGMRQDITYDLFREGVITDDKGKVILNLMQQDSKALRVVMRVGYQVAVPQTRVARGKKIYPAGYIEPAGLPTES